jgi:hypothetical protein
MVTTRKRQKLEHIKFESVKQEDLVIKKEEIETEVTEKKEEITTEKKQAPRYVHPNPYEFKGRLGYA